MKVTHWLAIVLLGLSGCATVPPPTPEQISAADYGAPVNQSFAEGEIKKYWEKVLKDPYSAQYRFEPLAKGYDQASRSYQQRTAFGYLLVGTVNAKNSFGGYVGAKPFRGLFRNGKMVSLWAYDEEVAKLTGGSGLIQVHGDYQEP